MHILEMVTIHLLDDELSLTMSLNANIKTYKICGVAHTSFVDPCNGQCHVP